MATTAADQITPLRHLSQDIMIMAGRNKRLVKALEAACEKYGEINLQNFITLVVLYDHREGLSQTELAYAVNRSDQRLGQRLSVLDKADFITRICSDKNAGINIVKITPTGRGLVAYLKPKLLGIAKPFLT